MRQREPVLMALKITEWRLDRLVTTPAGANGEK
jgi:hypothetical protein